MVFITHAGGLGLGSLSQLGVNATTNSRQGVIVFFVVSAYCLCLVTSQSWARERIDWVAFYIRRFFSCRSTLSRRPCSQRFAYARERHRSCRSLVVAARSPNAGQCCRRRTRKRPHRCRVDHRCRDNLLRPVPSSIAADPGSTMGSSATCPTAFLAKPTPDILWRDRGDYEHYMVFSLLRSSSALARLRSFGRTT